MGRSWGTMKKRQTDAASSSPPASPADGRSAFWGSPRQAERLRILADHASDVIVQIDVRSTILMVNRAVEPMFGYRIDELVGQPLTLLMPASLREAHLAGLNRYLISGERRLSWQAIEVTGLKKSGETFPAEVSFGEYVADGETLFSGIIRDITARKEAETTLERTRARYEALVESVDGIVWEADARTFAFSFVSDRAESILGYPAARWVEEADFWASHIHPDDRDRAVDFCRRCASRKQDHTFEYRMIARDGRVRWLRDIVTFVENDGEGAVLRGLMVDITDRKQAELQIARLNRVHAVLSGISEAVVRATSPQQLFETACAIAVERGAFLMAWIGRVADDGRFTVVAQAGATPDTMAIVRELLEVPAEPACGQTAAALHGGRIAVCNDILADPSTALWREAAIARGYRAMVSLPLMLDGVVVGAFNLYAPEPGFFDAAEVSLLEQVGADVAFYLEANRREVRRQLAEGALRASEERFREIAETIQEVFWISDATRSRVLYVSPAYVSVWGRSTISLYDDAQSWTRSIHEDDREHVRRVLSERTHASHAEIEYRIVRPDGEVRWIRDLSFPVRDAAGQVERIVGVAADITDRKAAEARVREAQKMESVGRLAAGLAHDFNNVLTVITGIADLAMSEATASAALKEHLTTIKAAGERAAQVTRQLLAFGRKQVLHPTVVNLNALVREAEPLIRRLLGESVRLQLALASGLGRVKVDAGQLHQVILNLVVNSRDAMPQGGTLTIRTRPMTVDVPPREWPWVASGSYAVLEVEDTGVGMDLVTQQRIFEPFFTTKPPEKGSGLGLSTVHGTVKQSGGELTVVSEPGRGTTIAVWLPIVDAPASGDRLTAARRSPRRRERILVVDDDAGVRMLATRVLERAGYIVSSASSGSDALEMLNRGADVDLILSDVVMPGMNGRELAEEVWRQRPEQRVVFMTGYTEDVVLQHGVLERGLHLIGKPYTAAQLTAKIRDVLDS
jgi:PAS domain S-box-containing protein